MKRTILTSTFAFSIAAATLMAQTPTQTPTQTSTPQTPSTQTPAPPSVQRTMPAAENHSVVFSGCLERGMAATSATPGAIGTSGSGAFVLANAMRGAAPSGGVETPLGTSGSASSSLPSVSYRLDGDETKLAPHIGHKVEITGTLDDHTASPTNRDTTSGNIGVTSGNTPSLKVESVKMISANCLTQ